jgi:trigger factor
MQVNVQKLSPVLVEFSVEVGVERVNTEVDKAYGNVAKTARVRGFRPGKAPRKVLAHVYGPRIIADVARRLVDETLPKAMSEHNLQPLSSPSIEQDKLEANRPFLYKARFEVVPEVKEVKYEGIRVKRPKVEVKDEEVEAELSKLRAAHATLEPPKQERGAREGDVLVVDIDVSVGGRAVPDAAAKDMQLELVSGNLIPAILDALRDKRPGDVASAEADMPGNHPHAKLRGKRASFEIEVKDLKEKTLPEADDEFAKDLGEHDTLAALKQGIREHLEAHAKEHAQNTLAERLVAGLVEENEVPIPPSLLERQMRLTEQDILTRARSQGQQATGVGDELKAQIRADSEIKVRAGLLMAEIAKKEGIKIDSDAIEQGLKELAEQTGKNIAKLRVEYRDGQKREMLVGMILENKVLDILESKAMIEDE